MGYGVGKGGCVVRTGVRTQGCEGVELRGAEGVDVRRGGVRGVLLVNASAIRY